MKQAKPCWVKKFSALETFRIIWKSGLSVPLLYPSDYPSQCQSLVKHLRTHSIHLAGPHVIIFFIDCHYNVNWRHHHSTHYPLGSKRMFSLSSYKLIPGIWFFFQIRPCRCWTQETDTKPEMFCSALKASLYMASMSGIFSLWIATKALYQVSLKSSHQSCKKCFKIFNCI